jgi:hypothetical protein
MKTNRVLPAARILLGFINDKWTVEYAIAAAQHHRVKLSGGVHTYVSDEFKRAQDRLRREIKTALETLLAGENLESVVVAIKKYATRPLDLLLWREGEVKTGEAVPYRFFQQLRTVTLADKKFHVYAAGYPNAGPRQFFYSLLRQTIDDGTIERFKLCKQCRKLFYQKSKKAEFCGDRCRWYFNNHSADRARHYIKGKWYSDSEPKPKKRGSK